MPSALIRAFALRPLLVVRKTSFGFVKMVVSTRFSTLSNTTSSSSSSSSSSSTVTPTAPIVTLTAAVTPVKGTINTSVRAPPTSATPAATAVSSSSTASSSSSSTSSSQVDSVVHVNCTMNNIVVSVSTLDGEVISRCSGGMIGLKHRARASASAATDIARNAAQKAVEKGFKVTEVRLKGPSRSRGQILRGIQGAGMKISEIRDMTPMPTNGCRPPAARRL